MTTKSKKRSKRTTARHQLERLAGGSLTLAMLMAAIREGEVWSLAEMAAKLRVTRAHVAAIESGKPVSANAAARYARLLGYDVEQFVRLALQDQLRRTGLRYRVAITAEARS